MRFLGLFKSPDKGPQTQQERVLGALSMGIVGVILGVLAWCIASVATGNNGWLALYVVIFAIVWMPLGYIAPRWVREVIGTIFMIMTF